MSALLGHFSVLCGSLSVATELVLEVLAGMPCRAATTLGGLGTCQGWFPVLVSAGAVADQFRRSPFDAGGEVGLRGRLVGSPVRVRPAFL